MIFLQELTRFQWVVVEARVPYSGSSYDPQYSGNPSKIGNISGLEAFGGGHGGVYDPSAYRATPSGGSGGGGWGGPGPSRLINRIYTSCE